MPLRVFNSSLRSARSTFNSPQTTSLNRGNNDDTHKKSSMRSSVGKKWQTQENMRQASLFQELLAESSSPKQLQLSPLLPPEEPGIREYLELTLREKVIIGEIVEEVIQQVKSGAQSIQQIQALIKQFPGNSTVLHSLTANSDLSQVLKALAKAINRYVHKKVGKLTELIIDSHSRLGPSCHRYLVLASHFMQSLQSEMEKQEAQIQELQELIASKKD